MACALSARTTVRIGTVARLVQIANGSLQSKTDQIWIATIRTRTRLGPKRRKTQKLTRKICSQILKLKGIITIGLAYTI